MLVDVVNDLERALPVDLDVTKRAYVFWATMEGDRISGFHRLPQIREHLVSASFARYGSKKEAKGMTLMGLERTCSICGETAGVVYGNFTDIACYNLDKPGFITGGFGYQRAPANFPICRSCILHVNAGRNYVERHLRFHLGGLDYWLLPKAQDPQLYQTVLRSIEGSETRQTLGRGLSVLTDDEHELFGAITQDLDQNRSADLLMLNLFFYEEKNAAWRITAEIGEILPSRLEILFEAKKKIQTEHEEMHLSKRGRDSGYLFSLRTIRPFCGAGDKQSDRRFLAYLEAIFKGHRLDPKRVFKDLSGGVVAAQKKNDGTHGSAMRDAWATYLFLSGIGAIPSGGDEMKKNERDSSYEAFMEANSGYFGNAYRRAAFLTGCTWGPSSMLNSRKGEASHSRRSSWGVRLTATPSGTSSTRLRGSFDSMMPSGSSAKWGR